MGKKDWPKSKFPDSLLQNHCKGNPLLDKGCIVLRTPGFPTHVHGKAGIWSTGTPGKFRIQKPKHANYKIAKILHAVAMACHSLPSTHGSKECGEKDELPPLSTSMVVQEQACPYSQTKNHTFEIPGHGIVQSQMGTVCQQDARLVVCLFLQHLKTATSALVLENKRRILLGGRLREPPSKNQNKTKRDKQENNDDVRRTPPQNKERGRKGFTGGPGKRRQTLSPNTSGAAAQGERRCLA